MKHTKEVNIVIPVRIDCIERLRNLELVLHSLHAMNLSVIVLEADSQPRCSTLLSSFHYRYEFVEDRNEIFHRTHYLNQLLHMSTAPVVGIWDTDVLVSPSQIEESLAAIRTQGHIMSSPYNGNFRFLSEVQSAAYAVHRDYSFLQTCFPAKFPFATRPSWGGAFLVDRLAYLRCGGENERFYGWGPEDVERVHRLDILGHPPHRVAGAPLYHLWHPRGVNSFLSDTERAAANRSELIRICSMTRQELEQDIQTW